MQLSAGFVPALETALVLRFKHQDAEVIIEGEVAWRKETAKGGEFGVRFTALDSQSVQALKALCQAEQAPGSERPSAELEEAEDEAEESVHDTEPVPAAAPAVRLHIDGLSTPMHARIKDQDRRRIDVSSQLEFLRVGRSLQIEDLAQGGRREAQIDKVDVSVDHESRVPELIVSMRYADAVSTPVPARARSAAPPPFRPVMARLTPEPARVRSPLPPIASRLTPEPTRVRAELSSLPVPSVTVRPAPARGEDGELDFSLPDAESEFACDLDEDSFAPPPPPTRQRQQAEPSEPAEDLGSDSPFEGDRPFDGERLREHMDGVLSGVSLAARAAAEQCVRLGGVASRGAGWLVARARSARAEPSATRAQAQRRRTTAPPRAGLRSALARQQPRLTASGRGSQPEFPSAPRRGPRLVALAGLLGVTALVGVFLGRGGDAPEPATSSATRALPVPASATPAAAAAPAALDELPETPPPAPSERTRIPGPPDEDEGDDLEASGAVAQVPLFGPTSLERKAPAQPPAFEARALSRTKVADQSFDDFSPPKPRARREAPTEFASGRLHLPIVYRLRLDQPGEKLRGERTSTGFDVVIPGRKVMESGAGIAARDRRIAKVVTQNGGEGTRVSFRFRRDVPPFKVRLRKDFVEFFISAP
jgi:PilZ domain-containing protein